MKAKAAIGKVLVGVLVGGGAVWLSSLAVSRVETLQKYPIIAPAILAGAAILLYKRNHVASALGLAGAIGVLALFMLQAKGYLQLPSAGGNAQPPQTAGYPDAGRMVGREAYSGWRERPAAAGALQGPAARAVLNDQQAMGVGEAGALMGRAAQRTIEAMGLHA